MPKLVVAAGVAAGVLGLAVPVGALMPMLSDAIWDTAPVESWEPVPAPAPEPPPAPAPEPTPEAPPTPSPAPAPGPEVGSEAEQTPEAQAKRKELDDAIKAAKAVLANPGCRDLVGGNALKVLDDVAGNRAGKTQVYDFYALAKVTDDGRDVYAETDVVGSGSSGTLYFYKSFHDSTLPTSYYNPPSSPDNKMYELTKPEQQMLVVLHELMHLTGTLTGDHTSTDALGNTDSDIGDIQDQIITNCIPNAKRVARPKSGGDDAGLGDGGGGPSPDQGPVIVYTPPPVFGSGSIGDPGDSEPPVLGECCDEVPTPTDPGGSLPPDEPQCYPEGCYDPDPGGVPYDPGYGGGGGGGGGYGGGDCWYDADWDWLACEAGYLLY